MKIGFFGNTGNYPFLLALAMRDLGHDVRFFIDRIDRLDRPEHRFPDISYPYPEWITDVSPFRVPAYAMPNERRRRVVEALKTCDAVILNGLAPTLSNSIGRPAIVWLTGSDLENWANPENQSARLKPIRRSPSWFWRLAPIAGKPLLDRLVSAQRE